MPPTTPYFFISYSRADSAIVKKLVAELRERDVNAWVDTENLVPGSPEWEREIERSIRGSSGLIVVLSPEANNSQWVRRELSFAEENDKPMFPVLVRGDENDSIPLRLSAHQRVDLRRNFQTGMNDLANAMKKFLGGGTTATQAFKKVTPPKKPAQPIDYKKFALPAALALVGLLCLGGIALAVNIIRNIDFPTPAPLTEVPATDDIITPGATAEVTAPPNYPEPTGHIVFTCNVAGDEICLMEPDGSNRQRLTDTPNAASYNASLSPDGKFIVYVVTNGKTSEIYEYELATGDITQLTDLKNIVGSPEISPDNSTIAFHYVTSGSNFQLWFMDRDGGNPREFYSVAGKDVHDPTWSPSGDQLLFAQGKGENNQLYIIDADGGVATLVNDTIDTRGRSDWSVNDLISFDQGGPFAHDVYLMNANDGSGLRQVSEPGINAQGASLSPDGNWIAFTAYTDVANKDQESCEIFIMRIDGTDLRQLTDNGYCDYQPRWGK